MRRRKKRVDRRNEPVLFASATIMSQTIASIKENPSVITAGNWDIRLLIVGAQPQGRKLKVFLQKVVSVERSSVHNRYAM